MYKQCLQGGEPSFKRIFTIFMTICIIQIVVLKITPVSIEEQLKTPVALGLVVPATAIAGFTLAEVLTVVAVLGIVSALTIPTLIRDISDKQHKAAFKKNYSVIAQATKMVKADNGGTLVGAFNSYGNMKDKYLPYLKYVKKCDTQSSLNKCWHNAEEYYLLNGNPSSNGSSAPGLVLNNGAFIIFTYEESDCTKANGSLGNLCGSIKIDVNGFKKPNTIGKDIFSMHIIKGKDTLPFGVPEDNHECLRTEMGTGCAYNVLMNIDY